MGIAKARRLRRLMAADDRFYMVALDQRAILANMLAQLKQVDAAQLPFGDMLAVKRLLVEALAQPASAMLYDPNIAVPAAIDILPADTGLVVSLEHHKIEETPQGRMTRSIPDWSVEKIQHLGADAVKLLIWYHPGAGADSCWHQQEYVRAVGDECAARGMPLVLELLAYKPQILHNTNSNAKSNSNSNANPADTDANSLAEFSATELTEVVVKSVHEFSKPEYQVDLFKLESPVPPKIVNATDAGAEHEIQQAFDSVGRACKEGGIPWVLLSAGVTTEQFIRLLGFAYRAGANGFLAGRAIWKAPLDAFPDLEATSKALHCQGADALQQIVRFTQEHSHPVLVKSKSYSTPAKAAGDQSKNRAVISAEGDFARNYP